MKLESGRLVEVLDSAQSVATGSDGSVWATSFTPPFPLSRFDGDEWATTPCDNCSGTRGILGVDLDAAAWVTRGDCGFDGVTRFDPNFESEAFDQLAGAHDAAFSADGAVWVAIPDQEVAGLITCGGPVPAPGAGRLLDAEWRLYTEDDGLPSSDVAAVEIGPDGAVYLGTRLGVVRFDPETFELVAPGTD
jgi:hypothetical protein